MVAFIYKIKHLLPQYCDDVLGIVITLHYPANGRVVDL